MCQYSSDNGHATDWHLIHLGGFATRGVAAVTVEATAVVPEGRISPEDAGLWTDTQIEPLKHIVNFSHAQTTKIGIQLAHAGRKASTRAPWVQRQISKGGSSIATKEEGGWPDNVYAPSAIKFSPTYPEPKAMTDQQIHELEDAFLAAVERAKKAGFDFIEIHGAHGYLLHNFLSPLSNIRDDKWGGQALENRLRLTLQLVKRVREAWSGPLFVRLSATDWAEGLEKDENGHWKQWGIEQTIILVGKLKELGVDLIDVSSGGNWVEQQIPLGPGYQVPFAEAVKKAHPDIAIGAVGLIQEPVQANEIIKNKQADIVFLARQLLGNPHWALHAAKELGFKPKAANQYERAWL
ncbi:putative NADH:flavin oxidoreductase 2 [Crepidotus variabilis]|uniref:NADH:flavin oxidoreductase 2 n=1 Tax=Crepidotus variabilis TaxID=179855 RepID=A0A9P6JWY4_9AGAR|nr:putative NADH:flavin oxidoreductase 2 [Crepidotus variabilis]